MKSDPYSFFHCITENHKLVVPLWLCSICQVIAGHYEFFGNYEKALWFSGHVVRRWLPDIAIKLMGDTAYSILEMGLHCASQHITLIAPFRLDSVIWILTRDPGGKRPAKTLFSTDQTRTTEQGIMDFMHAPSPGRRAFGGWCAIMSGFPLHLLVFI